MAIERGDEVAQSLPGERSPLRAGGVCLAGVCQIEGTTSSSSATGSGAGGSSSSATGVGGSSATGTGGMMATSTSTGETTNTTTGAGAGGSAGEIPSSESGCGACVVGRGSANGAPWIGLGLLLVLRRRRQSPWVGTRS